MIIEIIIFLGSIFVLSWLGSSLLKTLVDVARYLNVREFIIAFFIMGVGASITNIFVDLPAALQGLAPLALGDILGGNLVDLTLVMAVIVFFSKKDVSTDSRLVQGSSLFTFAIAILPVFLIWDKKFTRLDGLIMIAAFFIYVFWIFSDTERYKKVYSKRKRIDSVSPFKKFKKFLKNIGKLIVLITLLLLASQGVIKSAQYFSISFGISMSLVGVLILGLANGFPELYFGLISAKRGQGWMIVGDMMGSVISAATLVLGIVAFVAPFEIEDMTPFLLARIFTIIAAIFFFWFIKSGKKITKLEAVILVFIYVLFLISQIFGPYFFK